MGQQVREIKNITKRAAIKWTGCGVVSLVSYFVNYAVVKCSSQFFFM